MFRGKAPQTDETPDLIDRAFAEGCTRLSVISLHPGAGARTVLESIANELHDRGVAVGITRAPRLALDSESVSDAMATITLPEGAIVATTRDLVEGPDVLEPLGPAGCSTVLGDLDFFRVTRPGDVRVYGPDDPESIGAVLRSLDEMSGGLALVDGAWERRAFAAPDVAEGVILAVGAGHSKTPERAAAAVRYTAEILALPRADDPVVRAWYERASAEATIVLDADARAIEQFEEGGDALVTSLRSLDDRVASVMLPRGLHDGLLGPLVRSSVRCKLVLKDPTCFHAAPVYYRAWTKYGGEVAVIEPARVFAVATNPANPVGPDADPEEFRALVAEALPDLPVHDVRLDTERTPRKPAWKLWA